MALWRRFGPARLGCLSHRCERWYSALPFESKLDPGADAQSGSVNEGGATIDRKSDSTFESSDVFERRVFGSLDNSPNTNPFFRKLDRFEKTGGRSSFVFEKNEGGDSYTMDGFGESFHSTLSDGLDEKLRRKANTFQFTEEICDEDYSFRPDMTFRPGSTYTTKDLDLTRPGVSRSFKREEFETTTQEVLKKADFRNVRFLSNFLTEAGIIIKRSQTKISAKAQRKIAREIKTARAFGLMPFTTMGTKPFIFGKSMKDDDDDYEYDSYTRAGHGPSIDPVIDPSIDPAIDPSI